MTESVKTAHDRAFAVARSLWPKAEEPKSEGVRLEWSRMLRLYSDAEVVIAFERLASRSVWFPTLAELCDEVAEVHTARMQAVTPKLPEQGTLMPVAQMTTEQQLAEFDRAMATMRTEKRDELRARAAAVSMPGEELVRRLAEIDSVGPMEQRARALIAGDVEPREGLAEILAGLGAA